MFYSNSKNDDDTNSLYKTFVPNATFDSLKAKICRLFIQQSKFKFFFYSI